MSEFYYRKCLNKKCKITSVFLSGDTTCRFCGHQTEDVNGEKIIQGSGTDD